MEKLPLAVTVVVAVAGISVGVEVEMGLLIEVADATNGMAEEAEDCWFVPEHPFSRIMMQMQIPISFWVILELIFTSFESRFKKIIQRIFVFLLIAWLLEFE
jgi:hypothetical protein